MADGIDGIALGCIVAGGVLIYAGVRGYSIPSLIQGAIQGKPPSSATKADQIQQVVQGATGSTPVTGVNIPAGTDTGGGSPAANKALGALMASAYGWAPGTDNWSYLESGWEEESGWSTTAANNRSDPYNNAYGIPQANPGTKMASAGADWKTSASTQIAWGLGYIKATYGSPVQVPNWSANGPLPGYEGY